MQLNSTRKLEAWESALFPQSAVLSYQLAGIDTRNDFGKLLTALGHTGRGVEIGTHRGEFLIENLRDWQCEKFSCVDPWHNAAEYVEQAKFLWGGATSRNEDLEEARRNLAPYAPRVEFIQQTSIETAHAFDDASLDFVHVDGDHSRDAVKLDLQLWWPKLKAGGLLAGHDIVCLSPPDWGANIRPALEELFPGRTVYVVIELPQSAYRPWSYFLVKD